MNPTPPQHGSNSIIPRWMTLVQSVFSIIELIAVIIVGVYLINDGHPPPILIAFGVLVFSIFVQGVMGFKGLSLMVKHNDSMSAVVQEQVTRETLLVASEKSLRTLLENTDIAFMLIDKQYRQLAWNKTTETHARALGALPPQRNSSILDAISDEQRTGFEAVFKQALAGISVRSTYTFASVETGETLHYEWRYNPVYDEDDKTVIAVCVMTDDVTELKRLKTRADDDEMLFREIAEHIGLTLWVYDLRLNKYLYVSAGYETMFGDSRQSLLDDPEAYQRMIYPADLARQREALRKSLSGEGDYDTEYRLMMPDGRIKWVWAHVTSLLDEAGTPLRSVGIAQDITHIKQAQHDALELAIERERRRLLSTFIRNISHEFRTPLATIHSGLYLLGKTNDAQERLERIRRIEEQAINIMTLVEDMVELTRLESEIDLSMQNTPMTPLLEICFNACLREAESQQIDYRAEITPDLPLIPIAPIQLSRAIRNLIMNALRYTEAGGRVILRAHTTATTLFIVVEDTGVGIDPVEHKRIFEAFYRVEAARNTAGFGLGLPVAQRIIELHAGELSLESTVGVGSTFTIMLPINKVDAQNDSQTTLPFTPLSQ